MRTQSEIRDSFWNIHTEFQDQQRSRKRQNDYSADIRQSFCDFVDTLQKSGQISDKLADRVTL